MFPIDPQQKALHLFVHKQVFNDSICMVLFYTSANNDTNDED
jgi:hypothetical protein